jgi:hypothetical protein
MKIKFPFRDNNWKSDDKAYHRYYPIHIQYILNIFQYMKFDIEFIDPRLFPIRSQVIFDCMIDDKLIRFDFSDFENLNEDDIKTCDIYFKFHYIDSYSKYENVFPFTPVNFHNWEEYYELEKLIKYKAVGKILNNQTPFGAAIERRTYVQQILTHKYGKNLSIERKTQTEFFKSINNGLVSICVPGARNNMLDRGQCQYFGLGSCTISPRLISTLSWNKKIEPGIHYIQCNDDYSDLIEKIEWVRNNKTDAIKIGESAKLLFQKTTTPRNQILWIKHCLNKIQ